VETSGASAAAGASSHTRRAPRTADEVASPVVDESARARIVGDVRFVVGDKPAAGASVEVRGAAGVWRATTDGRGSFEVDAAAGAGPFAVVATVRGLAPATAAGVRLEAGETRRVDTLWIDQPARVGVRVVAPDGSPVADAEVEAYRERTSLDRQDWGGATPAPEATVRTDSSGRARFDDFAVGTWSFRGVHPAFAPSGVGPRRILRGGLSTEIELRLEPGHALTGVVTGADGRPIAGTTVLALPPVEATRLTDPRPLDPLRVETRTDAEGRYEFRALATGEHSLAVLFAGALPARVGVVSIPSVSRFDVRLDGATLTGRVTDEENGRPIAGARVKAAVWRSHSPTYLTAVTDAEGRYALAAPLGGVLQGPARGEGDAVAKPVNFDVEKEGFVFAPEAAPTPWRNLWVFGGKAAEYDVVMRRAASLSGTVVGPDGPVAGAEVVADVWSPLRGSLPSRVTSDADGRYRFAGLPRGRARVVVTRPGLFQTASPGGPWRTGPAPDAAATADIPARGDVVLDVRLERGAVIRGRVVDESGAPVGGAEVTCDAPGDVPRRAASDASGAFAVSGVRPGVEAPLSASCDGYVDAETRTVAPRTPADVVIGVSLFLRRAGVVRGRVVRADGSPAPGAWVQIAPAKLALDSGYEVVGVWQRARRHPVAADGSFEGPVEALGVRSADEVVARAGAPGLAPAISARLRVEGGVVDAGTLRLEAGLRLEGRVVAADGAGPIAGARIEFQNERLPPALSQRRDWSAVGRDNTPFEVVARTGADGRFAVDGLPPWRYELRVDADGFGGATATVAVPQESEVVIEAPRLAPVAGRVEFDDGSAAARVAVLARRESDSAGVVGVAETEADGSFELPFLAAGRYVLEARRPSDRVADVLPTTTTPVDGGARDVKIVVKRGGGRIAGRCHAQNGAAVPGAVVFLKPVQGGPPVTARSAPDGRFEAAGLPEGSWTVTGLADRSVGPPSSFGLSLVADSVEVPVGTRDVVLEFREAAPISGRVVTDDGGVPAGELIVQARRGAAGRWTHFAPVGEGGTFQLATTSAGAWTLVAVDRNTGRALATTGAAEFAGGDKDVRLVVASSTTLSGRLVDELGRGVAGARVVATSAGAAPLATVTDADGRFTWTGLDRGPWSIEAVVHETGRAEATGVAPGGGEVALRLRPAETVSGRLTTVDGEPLRGAEVTLAAAGGAVVARLRTDVDGRFVTRALAPGEYVVSVTARDGRPLESPTAAGRVRSGAPEAVLRI
jgi:uncharacterized GH25 family protein